MLKQTKQIPTANPLELDRLISMQREKVRKLRLQLRTAEAGRETDILAKLYVRRGLHPDGSEPGSVLEPSTKVEVGVPDTFRPLDQTLQLDQSWKFPQMTRSQKPSISSAVSAREGSTGSNSPELVRKRKELQDQDEAFWRQFEFAGSPISPFLSKREIAPKLTAEDFRQMWPHAPKDLVDQIVANQDEIFQRYGITNKNRLAHFLAQITAETGGGREMTESLDYTPERLMQVSGFKEHMTRAKAHEIGHVRGVHPANEREIGNIGYGGRNGNRPGSDDGYNFRGRGLIQITGRENYERLGRQLKLDLVQHPELANDPQHALAVAAAEFTSNPSTLKYADRNNLRMVTHNVNGGQNGAPERARSLQAWYRLLKDR